MLERIELALKPALRVAVTQGQASESEVALRGNLIVSFIVGRWHRFTRSGFRHNPSGAAAVQIGWLLLCFHPSDASDAGLSHAFSRSRNNENPPFSGVRIRLPAAGRAPKSEADFPFRTVKEARETLYHLHKPETER